MSRSLSGLSLVLLLVSAVAPQAARAEGTDELTLIQKVDPSTELHVDILAVGEEISWEAVSTDAAGLPVPISMELFDPAGVSLGFFASGSTIPVLSVGTYLVVAQGVDTDFDVDADPDLLADWDLSVDGTDPGFGRVWADRWYLSSINNPATAFSEATEYNGSFYTLVSGGSPLNSGVVELKADGLVGRVWQVTANEIGIRDYAGRSTPVDLGLAVASQQIYLNPPEIATYTSIEPELNNALFDPGVCEGVAPLLSTGEIQFDSTVEGSLHFVCDIDRDGLFDFTDDDDVHILVETVIGPNIVEWDGTFDTGEIVPPGTYTCQVILTVGEFHYVANDVETSYPGFRLFSVDENLDRTGLLMYWNDSLVQQNDVLMPAPTSAEGIENTGLDGLDSGSYAAAPIPNVTSRAWGNFQEPSKGNEGLLDTYTWLDDDRALFAITVLDTITDTDGDDIVDSVEECVSLTDPLNFDTDGDGIGDGVEYYDILSDPNNPDTDGDTLGDGEETPDQQNPADSDGDGVFDLLDEDDDGDSIDTFDEVQEGDTDGDGMPDNLDTDDDGDGQLTIDEARELSADDDGISNYLDDDDDGDGILSVDEWPVGDTDGDGRPDALDKDDDDDGLLTIDETPAGEDPFDQDPDGDGLANLYDTDSDGDTLLDGEEGTEDPDADGDGNFVDTDSDNDTALDETEGLVDSDNDGDGDFVDPDDDNDTVPTAEEVVGDTDGDLLPDRIDPDDDGDTISTADEKADGELLTTDALDGTDFDSDGLPNWLDTDSDGDGEDDATEGRDIDSDGDGAPEYLDNSLSSAGWFQGGTGCSHAGSSAPGGTLAWGLAFAPLLAVARRRKKQI